jgi:multidrug efflux pump subunit AcrA (membrane-fusion protein)
LFSPSPPAGAAPVAESASHRTGRLLQEMTALLDSCPPPTEFYGGYLQRVLTALHGVAGAVWSCPSPDRFHLEFQCNLSEIGLEAITNGQNCHAELLRLAAGKTEPLWAPPRSGPDLSGGQVSAANLSGYGLLLAPILMDGECTGLVEVWIDFYHDSQAWRGAVRLLAEVAGFAAAYHHKTQLRNLQARQQLWEKLETFVRNLHTSLNSREIAYLAVNELRPLLGCDQVAVALHQGGAARVTAVSGATSVDRAGSLVRALELLCQAVLTWGDTLVYTGARDDALPAAVRSALDAYLKESNPRFLMAMPLKDERDPAHQPCRSALVAESFEATVGTEQLLSRAAVVAPHLASALYNAAEHANLPLGWLSRPVGRMHGWLHGRRWAKIGLALAAFTALAVVLLEIPAPLRREATGQLLPTDRQIIYAPVAGRIVELKVQNGDLVGKGQELLFMEDLEAQLKLEQLAIKIASAEHRLAVLTEQLGRSATADDRDGLTKERINQEYELRKAAAERDILLHGSRNAQKTPLTAPLAGKVVTFDVREQLLGKTVKPGDALLRVARVQGTWEIELYIPEANVGHVREGLRHSPDGTVPVDVLLNSQPDRIRKAVLARDGLGGESVVRNGVVVVPARVRIVDPELLAQLETMPVGVELRAKIDCGNRALGYVLFCDLMEFFFEHVWF